MNTTYHIQNFPNRRLSGLGLVADSKRRLQSGSAYDSLFPKPISTDPILNPQGTVHDTLEYCSRIVLKTLADTKHISRLLKRNTLNETCQAIFDFYYNHIQYQIDRPGVEQLRRPARAWQDRVKGIDCDCFTISVSSVLTNLGISHSLRMVKMYGRDYYQHIYIVVPKGKNVDMTKRNNYYVIDPVLNRYDEEAKPINELKDKQMTMQGMPIQYLNGVGNATLGEEFNGLGDNLGETDLNGLYKDYCRRCKLHLINTRNYIATRPRQVSHIYDVKGLLGAYDQLIGAWDNENNREAMLEKLSGMDENFLQPSFKGLGDIIHGTDDELFGLVNADFEGIGSLEGKKQKARQAATGSNKATKKTGVFTKMKHANRAAKGKGKTVLKKLGRGAFVKYNPAVVPIRAGFLAAMKTNTLRIASRLYWALFTESQAIAAGVSLSFYRKAVKGLEFVKKLFADKLAGGFEALKKAIITGRAAKVAKHLASKGKLNGLDGLMGLEGLGVVASASIAAAMTFLTAVATFLTKVMGKSGNEAVKGENNGQGKEEAETGASIEPIRTNDFTKNYLPKDTGPIVSRDNSEAVYNRLVKNQSGGGEVAAKSDIQKEDLPNEGDEPDRADKLKTNTSVVTTSETNTSETNTANTQRTISNAVTEPTKTASPSSESPTNDTEKKGNGGAMVIGVLAAVGLVVAMNSKGNKAEKKVSEANVEKPEKPEKQKPLEGIAKKIIKQKIKSVTLT